MEYRVKKGVKLPEPAKAGGARTKYPFKTMDVGELIFIPDKTSRQLSAYVAQRGRELQRKFRTQKAVMRQDLQSNEWEPCKPGAAGARNGVAICRIR